jgi:hypothetical protein
VVTILMPDGGRRDFYLGVFGSTESKQRYRHVIDEIRHWPPRCPGAIPFAPLIQPVARPPETSPVTVDEVILPFLRHAERYYRNAEGQ